MRESLENQKNWETNKGEPALGDLNHNTTSAPKNLLGHAKGPLGKQVPAGKIARNSNHKAILRCSGNTSLYTLSKCG
jgi:hypothetical protein